MSGFHLFQHLSRLDTHSGDSIVTSTNALLAMLITPDTSSNEAFLRTVKAIPILDRETERSLIIEAKQDESNDAFDILVISNLRSVAHIASGLSGYGLPQSDLVQEGVIGLIKAIKNFDPTSGNRLYTYAVQWIRSEIGDYIIRNIHTVKVATTKAQRKLFFNLRKLRDNNGDNTWMNEAERVAMADNLGVKPDEVAEMEKRLSGGAHNIDIYAFDSDDENYAPMQFFDTKDDTESIYINARCSSANEEGLHKAIEKLDPRKKHIIESRWLQDDKVNLTDLAAQYNVSAERIRQIEKLAMKDIRAQLQAA